MQGLGFRIYGFMLSGLRDYRVRKPGKIFTARAPRFLKPFDYWLGMNQHAAFPIMYNLSYP